jgi:alkylation response protein AidB-like acyl-CoA dehydrogenase
VGGSASATPDGSLRVTTGPRFVQGGGPAHAFVVAVREWGASSGDDRDPRAGVSLFLVDLELAGVHVEHLPGLPFGVVRVTFDSVELDEAARIGGPGEGWPLLERAAHGTIPYLCAFAAGGCLEVLDFTVEYSRQRWAFGQPIGRFQRVQDHVVELLNHADAARLVTAELLWRLDAGADAGSGENLRARLHEAAAVAIEAYYQAVNYSHMVHAGPGTDLDHPLMGHTLASRALYQWLGTPDRHKRLMMDALYPVSPSEIG